MTTFDRVVASDLASLGRDSAYRMPTVNASLAIIDAKRTKAPRVVENVADPARTCAVRMARLAGLTMASAASVLAVGLHRAGIVDPDKWFLNGYVKVGPYRGFPRIEYDYASPSYLDWHYPAVAVIVVTALAYLAAKTIALRTIDRRIPPAPSVLAARVGGGRLARFATGLAGLLGIATILLIATNLLAFRSPYQCSEHDGCLDPLFLEPSLIAFAIVASMLIAKVIATELGSRGWARLPSTLLDAGSTVVGITSFTALPTLFGILGFTVGNSWIEFLDPHDARDMYPDLSIPERLWRESIARDATLGTLAIVVVAATIGVICARETRLRRPSRWLRLLESPLAPVVGLLVGVATLWLGVHSERVRYYGRTAQLDPLQLALMIAGGLATFLVVTMPILRRRRAEQKRAGYSLI